MSDLNEMGFGLYIETKDGAEFDYADPEDMGFGGDEVMMVKYENGKKHHFDVAELKTVVLVKTD